MLTSRRGPQAHGATDLQQRLTDLGAHVTITACDISDPEALAALVNSVPTQHRLTAVVHTAAVLADTPVTELTGDQLDQVLAPKSTRHGSCTNSPTNTTCLHSSCSRPWPE
ncbi:short chain dehydrogenase family protein [Mycobacterium ulcerans str. Harvey]|uniref:Short chain dehydrogenase family protein n=2 Tax=Mycobacterium ulcerans str. Harvey TaxID=1299332 RepID=A0ABN0QL05_MYCUL|nr:short chain dehydrogenase family protein [Mycobacterium ulcerans str. Harvey]